ncbi:hypothetical protein [Aeoliella sp. SH292]|uniref:hypothetical protein n=1 Tax=Aeoliella sp. SH292 TaxID=3454464 RepID=UPI003F969FBE
MNDREKKLVIIVGAIVALWFGNWGWQKYSSWKTMALNRQTSAETAAQDAFLERQQARVAINKLRNWREQSLPGNLAVAQSQYRAWLIEKLQEAKLTIDDVSPRRSGQRNDAFNSLSYEVTAAGKLESVVRFLDAFYRSGQLHKITTLRLVPMEDSSDLRVTISVEALSVNGTKRETGVYEGKSDRLALASAEEYVERIVKRDPFVAYKKPVPKPEPRPVVVREERPKPAPRPEFNHAEHAKLTGVVSIGDDYQAWVTVQTLGERLYLRKGDPVKVGLFEGTVVDVLEKELVVETEAGVMAIRVGDTLTDGRLLTAAPATATPTGS